MTHSINDTQQNEIVIMLSVSIVGRVSHFLNVMLGVVMLSVVILNVVAPVKIH
jgi:hypothetical protein